MDSIRKKMQSMKAETDEMYKKVQEYEDATKATNAISDQYECSIRDMSKKVQRLETRLEETTEALQSSASKMEVAENEFKDKEDDVNAQTRRVFLLEEESRTRMETLACTVMKLASVSKEADIIVKGCRHWESNTMNNEVEIEEMDKHTREARKVGSDNEMKYDILARSLATMEDELKRADERVKKADEKVALIEDELHTIGENQKQFEISEEKARKREEKYQEKIKEINTRLKIAESRAEYAEMNISKLHLKIDDLEDEIIREKIKINTVSVELDNTFNEILSKY